MKACIDNEGIVHGEATLFLEKATLTICGTKGADLRSVPDRPASEIDCRICRAVLEARMEVEFGDDEQGEIFQDLIDQSLGDNSSSYWNEPA